MTTSALVPHLYVTGFKMEGNGRWCAMCLGCLVFLCALGVIPRWLSGQSADSFSPRPDNAVTAVMMRPNGDIFAGGSFKTIDGTFSSHLARLLPDGSVDRSFAATVNEAVYSIAEQTDGKLIIGGTFTTVNGSPRNRLARLQITGIPDTFAPSFDNTVYTISPQVDGKILVGGAFTTLGGSACPGIVRLNENGTRDLTFAAEANGSVYALVQAAGGKVIIGGTFTQVNGTARNRIARLNADGTLDMAFDPNADGIVSSLVVQADGRILAGGNFNVISGRTGGRLARLNPDGTADTSYSATANNWVDSIALQADGQAIIGGEFTSVNGTARNRVARISATGTLDAGFNPNFNWTVHGLALDAAGRVIVCGGFTHAGSLHRPQLARISNNVSATRSLTVTGTTQVDWARGGSAPELARVWFEVSSPLNNSWIEWTPLGEAVRVSGGWRMQGLNLPAGARIRARGRLSGGWFNGSSGWEEQSVLYGEAPPQLTVDKIVNSTTTAVPSGGTIDFGINDVGQSAPDITIQLNNPGPRELEVLRVEIVGPCKEDFVQWGYYLSTNTIYPGSSDEFDIEFRPQASGMRSARLRIWTDAYATSPYEIQLTGYGDAATLATSINPSGNVVGLLPRRDGSLILGGSFTTADGQSRNRLAKLNPPIYSLDSAFNPNVADGQVYGMVELADGKLLICGSFTTVGGVTRNRIARLNADGTVDSAFNPNASDLVQAMQVLPDGKILAAGAFTTIGGGSRSKVARLNADGTLDTSFNATPNSSVSTMLVQSDGKVLIGGSFSTVNSTARVGLARLNTDGSLDATFNANLNNTVMALAVAANGRLYAGGFFTTVAGYSFSRLVRLNTDGTPDFSFVCEVDDYVGSLVVQGNGSVVFSGGFDTVNGKARPCVARVQANGSLDPDFGAAIDTTGQVFGVALDRLGQIVLGGNFTLSRTGFQTTSNLAILNNSVSPTQLFESPAAGELRWTPGGSTAMLEQVSFETWNGNGWVPQGNAAYSNGSWSKTGLTMLANSWARATGRGSGGFYSRSGGFLSYEGSYGSALPDIALMFGGSTLNNGTILSMGTQQWLTAGTPKTFTIENAGGSPLTHLSVSMAGDNPADFVVTQPGVDTLAPGATTTFTVSFAPLGGGSRQGLLEVTSGDYDENPFNVTLHGTSVIPEDVFNPGANAEVYALAQQSDGSVLLGGTFTTMSAQARGGLARVNADGFLDASFAPHFSSTSTPPQVIRSVVVEPDGRILVGGDFTHVNGVSRSGIARLYADGTLDASYTATVTASAGGAVNCVARQADGKMLLAGAFTAINGTSRAYLGRLNVDGSLDTAFTPVINNTVTQVFVQADGMILVGGSFTSVNSTTRNRLARLNGNGTLDTTFNPNLNDIVLAFAQQTDGRLLIGGSFTTVGGVTRNRLARLNLADGTLDATFNPNANDIVQTLALQANGHILTGGWFTTIGGVTRSYMAKLNTDGSLDSSFDPNAGNRVNALTLQPDGRVLVGGAFTSIAGVSRAYCARIPNNLVASQNLTLTGNTQIDWARSGATAELEQVFMEHWTASGWTSLGAAARVAGGWRMTGLALPAAGQIGARGTIAGGYGGSSRGSLQQVISYGVPEEPDLQVTQEGAILAHEAEALSFPEQDWLTTSAPQTFTLSNVGIGNLSGLAVTVEGVHAGDFQVGSLSGTQLAPAANLSVEVTFRPRGGGRRTALLRIASNDPDESSYTILISGVGMHRDAGFYPSFTSGSVYTALQSTEGLLNIGGGYTTLNGVSNTSYWRRFNQAGQLDAGFAPAPGIIYCLAEQWDGKMIAASSSHPNLARYLSDGIRDTSFASNAANPINCLLIQPDGKVLVGGEFTNRLLRLNADGTTDTGFTVPSINGEVRSMVLQPDGKLIIGGAFTTVSGTTRFYVARLNANGSLDSTYNPPSGGGAVNALALQADGKVIVATNSSAYLYRLNTNGTTDATLTAFTNGQSIRSLALQTDGSILVGGTFSTINHVPRRNLARLSPTGVVDPEFDPGANGDVEGITVLPDGNIAVVGAFGELGGVFRSGMARIPNNVPATRSLTATGTTQLDWQIGGGAPAMEQVAFESWNGTAWTNLGAASRVTGGWRQTALSLPASTWIRATGRTAGGRYAGSSPLVRDVIRTGSGTYPTLVVEESGGAVVPKSSAVDFGTVSWPNQSAGRTYTIRNTGTAELANIAFSVTAATTGAEGDFVLTLPPGTSMASGASATFQVQFAPKYSGSRKISLSITSNDPIASPYGLTFLGAANYASPNPFSVTTSGGSRVEFLLPLPDGKTLVAGTTTFGSNPTRRGLARLTSGGILDTSFNASLNGDPSALVLQRDGRLLLAGSFTSVLGQTRNRLARLNADGSLDASFNPNVDSTINSLVVESDGKIILAGNFTTVGGVARNRLARLNADGTLDASYNPGADALVNSLVLQPDGKLIVGGSFNQIAGVARAKLARLLPSGALDTSFLLPAMTGEVSCLALLPDGRVLAGLTGGQIGGTTWNGVVRFSSVGTHDTSFAGLKDIPGIVYSIVVQADGRILVGGGMSDTTANPPRRYFMRLLANGNVDAAFNPNPDLTVLGLSLQEDGMILVGGDFSSIGGSSVSRLARLANDALASRTLTVSGSSSVQWDAVGSAPLLSLVTLESWNGSEWIAHPVTANGNNWQSTGLTLPGAGWVRATGWAQGGYHNSARWPVTQTVAYGAAGVPDLAVEEPAGSALEPNTVVNLGIGQYNQATVPRLITLRNTGNASLLLQPLALSGTHPTEFSTTTPADLDLAPGESTTFSVTFTPLGSGLRSALLDILSSDADESPFRIVLNGTGQMQDGTPDAVVNGPVTAFAPLPDGRMLIGGAFTQVDGQSQTGLARLLPDGSWDASFRPSLNSTVNAIAVNRDGSAFIGGAFTQVNGSTRNRLARLLPDGSLDAAFDPNLDGLVQALTLLPDGRILVAGDFNAIGGVTQARLARLLPDGTLDSGFNANANGSVLSIALQPDGRILASGQFTSIGGATRNRIARLNVDGSADGAFNPDANNTVTSLCMLPTGAILAGGEFTTIQGISRSRLARLQPEGTLDTTFDLPLNQGVNSIVPQIDGKVFVGGAFTTAGQITRNRLLRLNLDGSLDASFDPSADNQVLALAVGDDGSLFVGGLFSNIGGLPQSRLVRLPNNVPANHALSATGSTQLDWLRSGSGPEVNDVRFSAWNGSAWQDLGAGAAVPGGWRVTGLSLPSNALVRGEGRTRAGNQNGSSGVVAEVVQLGTGDWPSLTVLDSTAAVMTEGTAIEFGNQPSASASVARTYTLQNDGATLLTGISVSLAGAMTGEFLLAAPAVTQLAPGATTTFAVQYAPQSWGSHFASVQIQSNDPYQPIVGFSVSGYSGGIDQKFRRNDSAATGTVYTSLNLRNGKILIGGNQVRYFGVNTSPAYDALERRHADGSLDQTFTPQLSGSGFVSVYALAEQDDGKVLVGGSFTSVAGQTAISLIRLNQDGTRDTTFNASMLSGQIVQHLFLLPNGNILAGGSFTSIGGQNRNGLALLSADGTADPAFSPSPGSLTAMSLQPDGKILISGPFTTIGGVVRQRIARLLPDGSLDSAFNPSLNSIAYSIALQGDKILVAGQFTQVNGVTQNYLARLNADGTLDAAFNPNPSQAVTSLVVQKDGRSYVAGTFTSIGGQSRNRLARLLTDGSVDTGYNPVGSGNNSFDSLCLTGDGVLVVTGSISSLSGSISNGVVKLLNNMTAEPALAVNTGPSVVWMDAPGFPELYHANLSFWNGSQWVAAAATSRTTTGWEATIPNLPDGGWVKLTGRAQGGYRGGSSAIIERIQVYGTNPLPSLRVESADLQMLTSGQALMDFGSVNHPQTMTEETVTLRNLGTAALENISFSFSGIGSGDFAVQGAPPTSLAAGASVPLTLRFTPGTWGTRSASLAIHSNDAASTPFTLDLKGTYADDGIGEAPNDYVNVSLPLPDGSTLVGGVFTSLGGLTRNRIAKLRPDFTLDPDYHPNANGSVAALALMPDGKVLAGGSFTTIGGLTRRGIARLHPDGTIDPSWQSDVIGVTAILPLPDGKVMIGGSFSSVQGIGRQAVARLNADGSLDTSWNALLTGALSCLARQPDGRLIIGGAFTQVAGRTRSGLARLNANGTLDLAFNPVLGQINSSVNVNTTAIQADGRIVISGRFGSVNGVTMVRLARLESDGSLDTTFSTNLNGSDSSQSYAYSIQLQADGGLIIGGDFTLAGNALRNRLLRLLPNGSLDPAFDPNVNGRVRSLGLRGDSLLLVGGEFTQVTGFSHPNLALVGTGQAASDDLSVLQTDQVTWTRGGGSPEIIRAELDRFDGTAWVPLAQGVRVTGGWKFTGISLPLAGQLRARGWMPAGQQNGSSTLVEKALSYVLPVPEIAVEQPAGTDLSSGAAGIGFGNVLLTGSSTRTFTVKNSGTASLTGLGITIDGTDASDFSVTTSPTAPVEAGGQTTFVISFSPTTLGTKTAQVHIASNDADENPFEIFLSGTGLLQDFSFTPTVNSTVFAAVPQDDGKVLLGGQFTNINGAIRNRIARLNADGTLDAGFNPDANNTVECIVLQPDGKVLVGGGFTSLGGVTRNRIARLNADGTLDTGFNPDANNSVRCFALQSDGKVVVGGFFTTLGGVTRNRIARLNADGTLDASFNPDVSSTVQCLALQPDGKVLIGGDFTAVGGVTRNRSARLNADGTLDSGFNPDASSTVYCLALQPDAKVVIGGSFTTLGGVACLRLGRLHADGTRDGSFNPGMNDQVYTLAAQSDGKVLAGGRFTSVGGTEARNLARLNANGTVDSLFTPNAEGFVYSLALDGEGRIMVGGQFTMLGGVVRNRLGRLPNNIPAQQGLSVTGVSQIDWARGGSAPELGQVVFENWVGSAWAFLGAAERVAGGWRLMGISLPANTWVRAQGRASGGYCNGSSSLLSQVIASGGSLPDIAVEHPSGTGLADGMATVDFGNQAWQVPAAGKSFTIRNDGTATLGGLALVIGGAHASDFTASTLVTTSLAPGESTTFSVTFTPQGAGSRGATLQVLSQDGDETPFDIGLQGTGIHQDGGFTPIVSGTVLSALQQQDGRVLLAGSFISVNGVTRNRLARLLPDGSLDSLFNPDVDDTVYCTLLQPDGKIWIGGEFTAVGGVTRNRLARLNADGTLDTTVNPNVSGGSTIIVHSLAWQPDGKLLLAGEFTAVGSTRNRIARLNANGTLDTSFNPNANSTVYCLALQPDGKILLGGAFTTIGGTARSRIARLNSNGTLDTAFDPNASGVVTNLLLQPDGDILLGGTINAVGGVTRNRMARLNADGTLDTSFNPNANNQTRALALQADGKILVGGDFTNIASATRGYLARLLADGTIDPTFDPGANSAVYSLSLQSDGKILAGGNFTTIGGTQLSRFIRLPNNIPAEQTVSAPGLSQIDWIRGGGAPEVGQVTLDLWSGSSWVNQGAVTRVTGGWRVSGLSLPASGWVRARGYASAGVYNGSQAIIEQIATYGGGTFPNLVVEEPVGTVLISAQANLDYGTHEWLTTSTTRTITIRNTGTGTLSGLSLALSGRHPADFTATSFAVTSLLPGESTTFDVTFTPQGGGARTAWLSIASNDGDSAPFEVRLAGHGVHEDPAFTPALSNGSVSAVLPLPGGGVLVGGAFTAINGMAQPYLARLRQDGSLDQAFTPKPDNLVTCLVLQTDGKVLIGGQFASISGIPRNRLARLNGDGTLDMTFNPSVSDWVICMALQVDGKILVGGNFTTIGGVTRNRLARLNADGTLDTSFNADLNSTVYSLVLLPSGKVLAGGFFSTVGGVTRNGLARLNADGTLDASFNMSAGGVYCLATQADGKILVGGAFTSFGGSSRNRMARLNADATLDTGFNPNVDNSVVTMLVQADGRVLLGGGFTAVGGIARSRLARLNADGSLDGTFAPEPDNQVQGLALQPDGQVLVGGGFANIGGTAQSRLARLPNNIPAAQTLTVSGVSQMDWARGGSTPEVEQTVFGFWNGTAWESLGSPARIAGGWQLTGLALPPSTWVKAQGRAPGGTYNGSSTLIEQIAVYGGGTFPDIAIEQPSGSELVDGAGTVDFGAQDWFVAGTAKVFTIRNNGTATLGGLAISLDGAAVADFLISQPGATSLAPGESTTFSVTFKPNGGGDREASLRVASFDADETPFDIVLKGVGIHQDSTFGAGAVSNLRAAVPLEDGKVLLGGSFVSVGGVPRNRVARVNADGSLDNSFQPDVNSQIECLATQPDGSMLLGGYFTSVNGITMNRMARLHADGTLDSSFNPDFNSAVTCITQQGDGKVLVGGYFGTVGGVSRTGLARLNANGTLDTGFNANLNSAILSMALQRDGKIVIGGDFTTVGGLTRNRIARLNADGTLDTSFNPDADYNVVVVSLQSDGKVLLAGGFTTVGGVPRSRLARVHADGTLDTAFNPGLNGGINSLISQADGMILMGGSFIAVGGVKRERLARLFSDGTLDLTFDPGASSTVNCLALQRDGRVIAGGSFSSIGGVPLSNLARLPNNISAVENLTVTGSTQIDWMRSGSAPEVDAAIFERWNGSEWLLIGPADRVAGGWRMAGLSLPANSWVRARSPSNCCMQNGSFVMIEQVTPALAPEIAVEQPIGSDLQDGVSSRDMGACVVAVGSSTLAFKIVNRGPKQLTGIAVTTSGSHGADFTPVGFGSLLPPGGSTTFTVTFTPSALGERLGSLHVASDDSDESIFDIVLSGRGLTPEEAFDAAMLAAGLSGPDALAHATPMNDGVANLLKYAFNMPLTAPDVRVLTPGNGTAGLPSITRPADGVFRVEFLRRIGSGLFYTPMKSAELTAGTWAALEDTPTVTAIDAQWERVVYEEPVLPAETRCFARVRVSFEP